MFIINDCPYSYIFGELIINKSLKGKNFDYIRFKLLEETMLHYIDVEDYIDDDGECGDGEHIQELIDNINIDDIDEKFIEKICHVWEGANKDLEILNSMYDLVNNNMNKCIKIIEECGIVHVLTYNNKKEALKKFNKHFESIHIVYDFDQNIVEKCFEELWNNKKSNLKLDKEYSIELIDL